MTRIISNMTANGWKKCYGIDGLITNIQGIGLELVRKDLHFISEGAFRYEGIDLNRKMNDPTGPELPNNQRNRPDAAARRCLWLDDVWLTGWKQIYGKWYCFFDTEKEKRSKNSWVSDETDPAKPSGAPAEDLNETGDAAVLIQDRSSLITYGEEDTKKETGNEEEVFMQSSYKYDYCCFKSAREKYITRL